MRWNRVVGVLFSLLVLLGGCGRTTQEASAPAPETVHTRWVEAVRTNDLQTALNLIAPGNGANNYVSEKLGYMRDMIDHQSNGIVELGPLQGVDVLPLRDVGQGKVGVSVWHFAKYTWCYETQLSALDAEWRVTSWGGIQTCPTAVMAPTP